MDIGRTVSVYTIEPIESPVPREPERSPVEPQDEQSPPERAWTCRTPVKTP
jgi:hypothetical protein